MVTKTRPTTSLSSSESWTIKSPQGEEYLVQIGYPRSWFSPTAKTPQGDEAKVSILYLTDGNSVFLSALEGLHRHLAMRLPGQFTNAIVVAIDYPIDSDSDLLWTPRRNKDLTPPTGRDEDGNFGGADAFADVIQNQVRPLIHQRLSDTRGTLPGREALYGHSYGGLFALHLLFTRTSAFDCYIVSSPSLWWADKFILKEEAAFRENPESAAAKPELMLYVGGLEQDPLARRGEDEEAFQRKKKWLADISMIDSFNGLYARLKESGVFRHLSAKEYPGEDHLTVIACAVNHGLSTFFDDWPYST